MYNRIPIQSQSQQSTQKMQSTMPFQIRLNDMRPTIKVLNQDFIPNDENQSNQSSYSSQDIVQNSNNLKLKQPEIQQRARLMIPQSSQVNRSYRIGFPYVRQEWQNQRQPIKEKKNQAPEHGLNLQDYNEFKKKRKYYYMKFYPHLSPLEVTKRTRDDYEKIGKKIEKGEKTTREKQEIKQEEASRDVMQQGRKENRMNWQNRMTMRVEERQNCQKREQSARESQ